VHRIILPVLAVLLACSSQASSQSDTADLIYVLTWEGCDPACQGFIDRIADSGLDSEIVVRDAAQDLSKLPGFVDEVRDAQADLVLTVGTSVTLAVIGPLDDAGDKQFITDIPVVFTFVADPFSVGIAETFDWSGRPNVTGTYSRAPETVDIKAMRSYDPDFRRLGMLFNDNEPNSVAKVDEMRALSKKMGFELIALDIEPGGDGPPDPALIPVRMAEIAQQDIDFMYVGSSSYLRVNAEIYTTSAVENGIAILSPYENMVRDYSALLAVAANEEDVGRMAAKQALAILRNGANPANLPIARATHFDYLVNMKVAEKLDRPPPFQFLQIAETVN